MKRPLIEILYFDGCPNHEGARELVERVSRELGVEPELRLVDVPDEDSARKLRFLGSPTIRVAGSDIEPHAAEREEYVLSCRVYRTDAGFTGQPDERWLRDALEREVFADSSATREPTRERHTRGHPDTRSRSRGHHERSNRPRRPA